MNAERPIAPGICIVENQKASGFFRNANNTRNLPILSRQWAAKSPRIAIVLSANRKRAARTRRGEANIYFLERAALCLLRFGEAHVERLDMPCVPVGADRMDVCGEVLTNRFAPGGNRGIGVTRHVVTEGEFEFAERKVQT